MLDRAAIKTLGSKKQPMFKKKACKSLKKRTGDTSFSVRKLMLNMKNFTKMRVGIKAGIYLSNVFHYLIRYVFDVLINLFMFNDCPKCDCIRSKHVKMVMKRNNNLHELTKNSIIPVHSPIRNDNYQ